MPTELSCRLADLGKSRCYFSAEYDGLKKFDTPLDRKRKDRMCARCGTRLSRYNKGKYCYLHEPFTPPKEHIAHAERKPRTHCKRGHELTPDNTYMNKGYVSCLTCKRSRDREGNAKRKRGQP